MFQLTCGGNLLGELDLSKNQSLSLIWCNDNQLTALDLTGLQKMWNVNCSGNNIQGVDMDVFVNSLPEKDSSSILIVYNADDENEGNVCTEEHVNVVREKGWKVCQIVNGEEVDFEGMPLGIETITWSELANKSVYNLQGLKTATMQSGINIIYGRKYLKK